MPRKSSFHEAGGIVVPSTSDVMHVEESTGRRYPNHDVNPTKNPESYRRSVRNVTNLVRSAPDHVREAGMNWYPTVHDAAYDTGSHGMSGRTASGIVSAVSPNMDFETHNINALSEIQNLTSKHWGMIERSAAQPRVPNPTPDRPNATKAAGRLEEVGAMMREVAPSLGHATDRSLLDARRMMQGEDPADVLSLRTSPKRHSFFQNIDNPSNPDFVTIDGRAADQIADQMRPWNSGRGIGSAGIRRGTTRYEDHAAVFQGGARALGRSRHSEFHGITPSAAQAVAWEHGKVIERSFPTVSGEPRKQGVTREGQSYQHRIREMQRGA